MTNPWYKNTNVWASVIGAVVGGIFTIAAVFIASALQSDPVLVDPVAIARLVEQVSRKTLRTPTKVENAAPDQLSISRDEVQKVVDRIAVAMELKDRYSVAESDQYAWAAFDPVSRTVIYNPTTMSKLKSINDWAVVGMVGHELGHGVLGHGPGYAPENEIEADEWSGRAMGRLGATFDEARSVVLGLAIQFMNNPRLSPLNDRLAAIENGWRSS